MLSYLTEARVYNKQLKDNSALSGSKSNHGDHKKEPEASFPDPLYPPHARWHFMGKPGEINMTPLVTFHQTLSQSSSFVNLVFFICLLMSITRPDEVEPTLMALIVNVLSIAHDILWIINVGDSVAAKYWGGWFMFGGIMTIFNLIARLPTAFLLYMDFKQMSNKS